MGAHIVFLTILKQYIPHSGVAPSLFEILKKIVYLFVGNNYGITYPSYINYCQKSKASITLHCQLCSTRYSAVQINSCLKSTSAIKVVTTYEEYGPFRY